MNVQQWIAENTDGCDRFEPDGVPTPTDLQPGSLEKIELLRRRVEMGQAMHITGDLTNYPTFTDRVWSRMGVSAHNTEREQRPR